MMGVRQKREVTANFPFGYSIVVKDKPYTAKGCQPHLSTFERLFGNPTVVDKQRKWNEEAASELKESKHIDDWENHYQRKILEKGAKRRYQEVMDSLEEKLNLRREKLRNLLDEEEAAYLEEMKATMETIEDRQKKLIEKAACFQMKKREENEAIAQIKRDQQFKLNCDELRSAIHREHERAVLKDRKEQLREKEIQKELEKQEEQYFENLWYCDYLNKVKREEAEALERYARNRETVEILNKQCSALQEHRRLLKELSKEETDYVEKQRKIFEKEKEIEKAQTKEQQKKLEEMINEQIRLAKENKAKEEQKDKEFDCLLEKMRLIAIEKEKEDIQQKKRDANFEAKQYLHYVSQLRQQRNMEEKELEKMIKEDCEQIWDKRYQKMREREEARKRMFDEVMELRRIQVEEREKIKAQEEEEREKEKEIINRAIEINNQLAADLKRRQIEQQKRLEQDLKDQMQYGELRKKREEELLKQELEQYKKQEKEYQEKIKEALSDSKSGNVHPMRFLAKQNIKSLKGEGDRNTDTVGNVESQVDFTKNIIKNQNVENLRPDFILKPRSPFRIDHKCRKPRFCKDCEIQKSNFNILSFHEK